MLAVTLTLAAALTVAAAPVRGQPVDAATVPGKPTPFETVVKDIKDDCQGQGDTMECVRGKFMNLLEDTLRSDSIEVSEGMSIVPNGVPGERSGRSKGDEGILEQIESYVKRHDLIVKASDTFFKGTTFRVSPRNLDEDELTMSVKLPEEGENAFTERGKKKKLMKILIPILVFVLLKAMTLIPLAIGVLGLKAWNALQLSFVSFLVSISLAIFQLCKKVAADSTHAPISSHVPWDSYPGHYAAAARNFLVEGQQPEAEGKAQELAFRAYSNEENSNNMQAQI